MKGWRLEPGRHALAAKGVPTGRKGINYMVATTFSGKKVIIDPKSIEKLEDVKDEESNNESISAVVGSVVEHYLDTKKPLDRNVMWEDVVSELQDEGIRYEETDLDELIENMIKSEKARIKRRGK